MDKWGYSYLIELKILSEKEKLLVTSNFSSSHNFFKSYLLLMHQNEYPWSKGLTHYQTTNFGLFQTERVCRWQFQIWWKWKKVIQPSRKHCGKRRNCSWRAISPFPSVFKRLVSQRRQKVSLCGNGLKCYLPVEKTNFKIGQNVSKR